MNDITCSAIPEWFPPPHGYEGVRQVYGEITVSNNAIIGPKNWEIYNMIKLPSLPGWQRGLYVNHKIAPMLTEALRQCVNLGLNYEIKSLGCFNPRVKRSQPTAVSMHSWGIAVDINADDNPPLRITSPADLARRKKTIPDAWVAVFKSIGFTWGGDFHSYFDPMHFQYCSGC